MVWFIYALTAIVLVGFSDIFRKLGSGLKDPIFANFIFQTGTYLTAVILFLATRKVDYNPKSMMYAFIGGILISLFTLFSFKALSTGPGISVVMPVLRVGGVALVAVLGVMVLKEKFTLQMLAGLVFAVLGIYLLFSSK